MKHVTAFKMGIFAVSVGILATLTGACGVPQKDVDALKQQLATKEQEVAKSKQEIDTLKKNTMVSIIPNAPPRQPAPPPPPGTPVPPRPTPPAPTKVPLFFYVDTVTAGPGESKYNVDASRYCAISGTFKRGMHIVWRMEVVDTATSTVLQASHVKSVELKLPNGETKNFNFGPHGTPAAWFWTAAWDVPPDYPLGTLDFSIEVTTNDGKTGIFKQIPVSLPARGIESRLTIVE